MNEYEQRDQPLPLWETPQSLKLFSVSLVAEPPHESWVVEYVGEHES